MDWERALDTVAARLSAIRERHGPNSIGVIASGLLTNEESYLLQKLARVGLGTNNIDLTSRLCHGPSIDALAAALGLPGMTMSYADLEKAGCILAVGTNTSETNPIVGLKLKAAARKGAKIILVDPRNIELRRFAFLWLRPRPGTDAALVNGMLRVVLEEGLWKRDFVAQRCEGFDQLAQSLSAFPLPRVAAWTGVPADDIVAAARLFASGGRDPRYPIPASWIGPIVRPRMEPDTDSSCIVYGAGVTQHRGALSTIHALVNLALLTGHIGKPGAGIAPLTGHSNTQGACDMGALPDYLPGYQPVEATAARERFAAAWHADLPTEPGLKLLEMVAAARAGRLKALYIVGANPMASLPQLGFVREALGALEFLVVQDIFPTATTQLAQVVLPASSFAEKGGTFTSLERRVQRLQPARPPVGESRPDGWIISELLRRLKVPAHSPLDDREPTPTDYRFHGPVLQEIRELVPAYAGIAYERLGYEGLQWPCPSVEHPGTGFLYAHGFPRGLARLVPAQPLESPELPDEEYPLVLVTGRSLYHFNTGTMSRRAQSLAEFRPHAYLEVHPADAAAAGIGEGEQARVMSRRGELVARAKVTESVPQGIAFLPFHYDGAPANSLTAFPQESPGDMPDLKYCPVRIVRA